MAEKSGTSIISLPQGGGALKGIGETFAPDLFTGTGNFSVPIALPPGRNGLQPNLSLVYSTGNGNSPFGLGWGLSVPGVRRKTSKGIPRYDDVTDVFILSGAEDLVPVSGELPGEMRYRPRTEGLFALITFRQDTDTNDSFWEVRSKDGLVSRYGTPGLADDDPATIADPADASLVFAWQLTQTIDPFGNRIEYEYERDRGEEGPHHWDQLYLKQIRYIDFDDEDTGEERFLVTVTLYYEERPDPFSDYRAGFEIRTRKRCQEIVVETHPSRDKRIRVRTYALTYLDELVAEDGLPLNRVSLLSQIRVIGHDDDQPLEADRTQELPPLEFGYTKFEPQSRKFSPVAGTDLPAGSLADPTLELTSLFGNGLTDIFEMNGTVRYWRNLGGGVFDRPREMRDAPAGLALADPGVQLIDANGDGRADLMVTSVPLTGYFPLTFGGAWDRRSFQRYRSAPSFDLEDPEVKLVDLDGDGVTDAVRSGSRLECFFNDPKEGWTRTRQVERRNLEDFPNVSFSDPRIKWADMSGGGLQNVVLVHDGHIDYWPNLGYGDWGKRVSMRNSPRFPLGYDPKRILFGDVDGDGLADLLYVDDHKVTLWINQSGNGWSEPIEIRGTPGISDMDSVRLDDLQGTGIAGVLWSGVFSAPGRPHMFFLDLTGGTKPYLLNEMNDHMGAVTRVHYASSTEFYLADQAKPATRWRTTLPFPVQVVAAVEVTDEISGGKLTTEYSYHHGYWDGGEREFRGFGRVDQRDTEVFDDYNSAGLHPERPFAFVPRKAFSPPTETRTWFHLGPVGEEHGPWEELDLSNEHWSEDPPMPVLGRPDELEDILQTLPRRARRDAVRAFRGNILRTELYAIDGSDREDRSYTVTEFAYGLREEDRPNEDMQAERRRIFFPHTLGQRTTQWERGDDPMTSFSFTDGYDEVGQPRLQAQIACPRSWRRAEDAPAEGYLATHGRTDYARPVDPDVYIMDRVARTTSFEILETRGKTVQQIKDQATSGSNLKITGQVVNYYDGPAFIGRAFGEVGAFGVLVSTETLIMTEDILREAYSPRAPASPEVPPYLVTGTDPPFTEEYPLEFRSLLPPLAGYIFHDGKDEHQRGFFANTTRNAFDFQPEEARPARGLLRAALDPLSQDLRSRKTTIDYDRFDLLPTKVTDPIGLVTLAEYDERILQPFLNTDPNGNQRQFSYTPLGLLQDVKMMGKAGANEGDREAPSVIYEYGFSAFVQSPENARQPIFVRTIRRIHHDSETDIPLSERVETITAVEFSDGFGRLIQTRRQAEDVLFGDRIFGGQVLSLDQNEMPTEVIGRRRGENDPDNVVVSGWQIFDNKGRVVENFEPFFSKGYAFTPPVEAELGQKVTLFYDARGQMIRTVKPGGSEKRVVFGVPGRVGTLDLSNPERFEPTPWEAFIYDENDNAGRTPDAPGAKHVPATHLDTPASVLVDALGRVIQSVERNGPDLELDWFTTVSAYDIRGNVVSVTDALDRPAVRYSYDLANRPLRTESIDAGSRRAILDAAGNEVERRDTKGAVILQAYDDLNRPIRFWARDDDKAGSIVTLRQRLVYGDGGSADQPPQEREANRKKNRLGALHQHFDEAGQLTFESYDFKSNVLEKARHVIGDEPILAVFPPSGSPPPEGGIRAFRVDWDKPNAEAQLDPQAYETSAEYDALNRAKLLRYPRDEDGERKELQPQYNRAGALEQVRLAGKLFVDHVAYDAKGQRTLIALGNKTITLYAYQPQTFRLGRQVSTRSRRSGDFSYELESVASEEERKKHLFQECAYEHDLVGNIVALRDRAPDCGLSNDPHRLDRSFAYDALYRLTSATGRECDRPLQREPWNPAPRCTDLTKTRKYTETYDYDPVGNMLQLRHGISSNGFTRKVDLQDGSNRLASVTVGAEPGDIFRYTHDANGNLLGETTSRQFEWDHSDQLKAFGTEAAGKFSLHAHYLYDTVGLRVKKLVRNQAGQTETIVYIDGLLEHHRRDPQGLTKNTLHVMNDQRRIAMVRAGKPFADDRMPDVQFQLSDHLDSSTAVIDEEGTLLNREEYTPYGETSLGSFARKQYRFGGKERDEESGLYYHGARYYAPWIARWLSVDPEQPKFPALSPFSYAFNNPMRFNDPVGLQPNEAETINRVDQWAARAHNVESGIARETENLKVSEAELAAAKKEAQASKTVIGQSTSGEALTKAEADLKAAKSRIKSASAVIKGAEEKLINLEKEHAKLMQEHQPLLRDVEQVFNQRIIDYRSTDPEPSVREKLREGSQSLQRARGVLQSLQRKSGFMDRLRGLVGGLFPGAKKSGPGGTGGSSGSLSAKSSERVKLGQGALTSSGTRIIGGAVRVAGAIGTILLINDVADKFKGRRQIELDGLNPGDFEVGHEFHHVFLGVDRVYWYGDVRVERNIIFRKKFYLVVAHGEI